MSSSAPAGAHVRDITTAEFPADVVERSRQVPVLVDFWATWCGPCRALGPILERLAAEYAGAFELAKVDTDQEQQLAMEFQVRSIPSVMLFRDGKVATGFQGALPEGQIRKLLAQHGIEPGGAPALALSADPAERVQQLRTAVANAPARDSLKLDLALAVLELGDLDDAARLLEALPMPLFDDARAVRARARLALRKRAEREGTDVRHATAIRAILEGQASAGLEQLIDLLRDEKHDADSPARAALVEAFQTIEDEAMVREWRQRMARVLF